MALYKPYWLRRALTYLNWDIFTWHVYIGDTIEDAFDWVIDWLNYAIKWAIAAWNKAVAAWDKAVEVAKNAWADLCKETTKLWNAISVWWSDLGDWWSTKVTWIRDLIDAAEDWLKERIDIVKKGLASLGVTWDNFWQNTWPQLVKDFNTWVVKVGNFFTGILPWLAEKLDITKAFDNFRLEWKDLFNFWGSLGREVMAFFADPCQWLLDRFTDWFLGKEK